MPTVTGIASEFITFSRTSNATLTDSDGKIKWAPHNLLLASEQFDSASWAKTSTTPSANAVAAPNGTTTADTLTASSANGTTLQSYTSLGVSYTFGIWLKRKTGTGNIQIAADSGTYTTVTITSDWALYTVTQTPAAGTISAGIRIVTSADAVEAWGAHLYRSDLGGMKANTSAYPTYNPTTPKNLLGYTEDFSNAAWTNSATTITTNAITAPNGLLTANKIVATATLAYHARYVALSLGSAVYTLSVYAKAAEYSLFHIGDRVGAAYGAAFDLVSGTVVAGTAGGAKYVSSSITPVGSSGWYRCSVVFSNPAASVGPTVVGYPSGAAVNNIGAQYTGDGTSGIYLWGAQLSDSASLDTYVPNYGAAPTAAAYYGPRLDYDPVTLAAKGLLVEELRVNRFLHTAEFDNASYWTTTGAVTAGMANAAVAPTGTSVADALTEDTSTGVHRIYGAATLTAATYTMSLYVKANGRQWLYFYLDTGIVTGFFNFTTNTYVPATGSATVSSVPVGNSWYRVTVTYPNTNTSSQNLQIWLATNGTTNSYAGDGTSGVYIWGAQLELGSFATSYMPNGSSVSGATRNADVASVSTQAFPYGATEGTVVINASVLTVSNPNTAMLYSFYADASNFINSFIWSGAPSTPRGTVTSPAGADQANLTAGTVSANTAFKTAFGFKASDFGFSLNGSAASTDGTGTMPSTSAKLELGAQASGTLLSGHIRQITYLPRRISNTELQTRTA
jgi:hypothetical protein